jgi:hypothetical protein
MRLKTIIFLLTIASSLYAQSEKDSLLKKDILILVEEMEFMYSYDQTLREYITFRTFDKSETNRIEGLPDSLQTIERKLRGDISDTLAHKIWKNYINPKDAEHTARLIEITRKYGFPSIKRIREYYDKDFEDIEFNPFILFIHSPKEYWNEIDDLLKTELNEERINRCTYGFFLWHISGRKSFQVMLDNGYEFTEENGKQILKSTCE